MSSAANLPDAAVDRVDGRTDTRPLDRPCAAYYRRVTHLVCPHQPENPPGRPWARWISP